MKISNIEVTLVDKMGTDLTVCNAARVSFAKETDWQFSDCGKVLKECDKKLIKYLAEHNHWSPFAHAFVQFRIKAPIFVARQLAKHQSGLVWNEVSRRYVSTEPEFYLPKTWRKAADNVKQGSSTEALAKPEYIDGFCKECGTKIATQLGHRKKEYCSVSCKSKCTNKHRNPYKVVFDNCKARVKREDTWEFSLDFDTTVFPEYCPYLGIKLDYTYGKGSIKENSPSFDRIDCNKGYTKYNVEIVSHKANTMKSNASIEEQIAMAKSVLLRYKGISIDGVTSPESVCENALNLYNSMIEDSYCAEQARMILPQNTMTEWIWSGSLYAFARVCNLRLDSHTQLETQTVAKLIDSYMEDLFPESWKVLVK